MLNFSESDALELQQSLSVTGKYAVMYSMEEMTSSKIDDVLSRNTHASFMLNLTVLCSLDSCKSFLKQVIFSFKALNNFYSAAALSLII